VKLAIVVQRYGQAINGGAELHARYIAEHLARHAAVEVLTTCATDYVTWRNELPAGVEPVNGVAVRRFRVRQERDPIAFGRRSEQVFDRIHSVGDELDWLAAEGPTSPSLVRYASRHADRYDFWLFFSYRYYVAYYGVRAARSRAVLVPTAERDAAIGLSIFPPVFRGVRALMYNSPEERAMIQAVSGNRDVPSVVVGVGSDVPANPQPGRFRQKYNIRGPFAVYVGRIDENKGCRELFSSFEAYTRAHETRLSLVLVGNAVLPIPAHPRIRHLGFLDDTDKFDAIAAADVLIMPSFFESLSMVALEAWALGKPVLANARCDVLKGQCLRSNAGLFYQNEAEFIEALRALEQHRWLAVSLGRNGRQYFRDQYDWPVIEQKYLDMFARLGREELVTAMEPIPGWLSRRRRDRPPAAEVVATIPSGPAAASEAAAPPPARREPAAPAPPTSRRDPDRGRRQSGRGRRPQWGRAPRPSGAGR
jgi:glycosyltransferase involved in cell wall biosynthesis